MAKLDSASLNGCTFVVPPESVKSKVAEDPGCHKVERIVSSNDKKRLFGGGCFQRLTLHANSTNREVISN